MNLNTSEWKLSLNIQIFEKRLNQQVTTIKIEQNHHDLCDDIMWSNIHVSGTPRSRGKRLGQEKKIKIIAIFFQI